MVCFYEQTCQTFAVDFFMTLLVLFFHLFFFIHQNEIKIVNEAQIFCLSGSTRLTEFFQMKSSGSASEFSVFKIMTVIISKMAAWIFVRETF